MVQWIQIPPLRVWPDKEGKLKKRGIGKLKWTRDSIRTGPNGIANGREKGQPLYCLTKGDGTWQKAWCAVAKCCEHGDGCHVAEHEGPAQPAHHVLGRMAVRAGSLPGSAITWDVFGKKVSSGIIDGDPTEDWAYDSDQSEQAPRHIRLKKFKTNAGTLTRLVGDAEAPTESTMSKAQVSLMNLYFAAFESMEVCNYHNNTACILGLIITNFLLMAVGNFQHITFSEWSCCDTSRSTQWQQS